YNGDELLYAIVRDRMRSETVNGVVGTLMTNFGLERRLAQLGIPFERAAVGDRYVLERLQQNQWLYGGESSGHLLCLDKHSSGDGIIAALQVLTAMEHQNQSLEELVADLSMYPQHMINVAWEQDANWQENKTLREVYDEVQTTLGDRGRVLIRPSGTEPKLRIMVEAEDSSLVSSGIQAFEAALA